MSLIKEIIDNAHSNLIQQENAITINILKDFNVDLDKIMDRVSVEIIPCGDSVMMIDGDAVAIFYPHETISDCDKIRLIRKYKLLYK